MMITQASTALRHQTVLLEEAVDALVWRNDGIYINETFGRGGHSRRILERLRLGGRLVAFDKDSAAITGAGTIENTRFAIEHDGFAQVAQCLDTHGIEWVAGVLLDLGISSPQIDEGVRSFSFRMGGPLNMRMDTTCGVVAAQWLAGANERDIARVIRDCGEERFAVQIAKAIVARRSQSRDRGSLDRTSEFAALMAQAVKTREKGQDPAIRTFQALQIRVDQGLADLETGLKAAFKRSEQGGRLVVVNSHSLEDHIAKRFMQVLAYPEQSTAPELRQTPLRTHELPAPQLRLLGCMKPSEAEMSTDPRVRSAIMHAAERC